MMPKLFKQPRRAQRPFGFRSLDAHDGALLETLRSLSESEVYQQLSSLAKDVSERDSKLRRLMRAHADDLGEEANWAEDTVLRSYERLIHEHMLRLTEQGKWRQAERIFEISAVCSPRLLVNYANVMAALFEYGRAAAALSTVLQLPTQSAAEDAQLFREEVKDIEFYFYENYLKDFSDRVKSQHCCNFPPVPYRVLLSNGGALLLQLDKVDAAESLIAKAISLSESEGDEETLLQAQLSWADIFMHRQQHGEAKELLEEALRGRERESRAATANPSAKERRRRACCHCSALVWLSCVLLSLGQCDEALAVCESAVQGFEDELGSSHPHTHHGYCVLGSILAAVGEAFAAKRLLERVDAKIFHEFCKANPAVSVAMGKHYDSLRSKHESVNWPDWGTTTRLLPSFSSSSVSAVSVAGESEAALKREMENWMTAHFSGVSKKTIKRYVNDFFAIGFTDIELLAEGLSTEDEEQVERFLRVFYSEDDWRVLVKALCKEQLLSLESTAAVKHSHLLQPIEAVAVMSAAAAGDRTRMREAALAEYMRQESFGDKHKFLQLQRQFHFSSSELRAAYQSAVESSGAPRRPMTKKEYGKLRQYARGSAPALKQLLWSVVCDSVDDRDEFGMTLLMDAALSGNSDSVALLLSAGAQVNVRDNSTGYSALMGAASRGFDDMVTLLLAAGADITMKTRWGQDAYIQCSPDLDVSLKEQLNPSNPRFFSAALMRRLMIHGFSREQVLSELYGVLGQDMALFVYCNPVAMSEWTGTSFQIRLSKEDVMYLLRCLRKIYEALSKAGKTESSSMAVLMARQLCSDERSHQP